MKISTLFIILAVFILLVWFITNISDGKKENPAPIAPTSSTANPNVYPCTNGKCA